MVQTEGYSVLCVIDGRFLPVRDYSLRSEQNTDTVYGTSTASAGTKIKSVVIYANVSTWRDPMLTGGGVDQFLLITKKQVISLTNARVVGSKEPQFGTTNDPVYSIETVAEGLEEAER